MGLTTLQLTYHLSSRCVGKYQFLWMEALITFCQKSNNHFLFSVASVWSKKKLFILVSFGFTQLVKI